MSKTDKTRPWRVQALDAPAMRPDHSYRCVGRGECDLPADPWSLMRTDCTWEPAHAPTHWRKMFSDSSYRQVARRDWNRADRTAQRTILRSLTRDANSLDEVNEDVIDNRQTHRFAAYGGGWWD